jgi:hypothetical protein
MYREAAMFLLRSLLLHSTTPRWLSITMLLACSGVLNVVPASAIPSGPDSDVPCGLILVGSTGGVADPRGQFTITVRDAAHNPIAGISVVIDFNACTPDIRLCSTQLAAGVTADCSGSVGSVSAVTDGTGSVVMRIMGGANNCSAHTPGAGFKCATVSAGGVNLGNINVAAFDLTGDGGVNPADISVWIPDQFDYPTTYVSRSDYNCSGTISPADLSLLFGAFFADGSTVSCAAYCH